MPAPRVTTPASSVSPMESPAPLASYGPRNARPTPRRTTQTSAGRPGPVPAQSSPLVTAPVLTANSTRDDALLTGNNQIAGQTCSPMTLADEQGSADTRSDTRSTLADMATSGSRSGDRNDNNGNNDSALNQTAASSSLTPGPSNISSPKSSKTRGKQPKKVTGKYVVHVYYVQSTLIHPSM